MIAPDRELTALMIRRMRPAAVVLVLVMSPVALGGCGAFLRQPDNVEATRQDVESLRRDQTELLALVRELRTRLENQSEAVSALRADNNVQFRQLEQQLETLQAKLEDRGVRSGQRRYPPNPPPMERVPVDSTATPGPAGDASAPAPAAPATSPSALFDAAQRDYNRGNYQLALAGFEDVLKQAPDSDLADDAQYWKGECYYSLGDMEHAIQEFLKVRDLYPDGNRVPTATLKIGYAFLRQGDEATARRYFETVIREFPNSDEAPLARDKLASLH